MISFKFGKQQKPTATAVLLGKGRNIVVRIIFCGRFGSRGLQNSFAAGLSYVCIIDAKNVFYFFK